MFEPVRMLANIGMVRRTLEGDIQRDLQLKLSRARHQMLEILQRAESRINGFVAAGGRTNRPGASWIIKAGGQLVVSAFAMSRADRVNRRQVNNIKAQLGNPRQPGGTI